eukprot:jgi/Ulvmu1/4771/UM020_0056.1
MQNACATACSMRVTYRECVVLWNVRESRWLTSGSCRALWRQFTIPLLYPLQYYGEGGVPHAKIVYPACLTLPGSDGMLDNGPQAHGDARRARRQHRKRVARIVCQQWLRFASQALIAVRHRRRCLLLQAILAFKLAVQQSKRCEARLTYLGKRRRWQCLMSVMDWWRKAVPYARSLDSFCREIESAVLKRQRLVGWDAWLARCIVHRRLVRSHVRAARSYQLSMLRRAMSAFKKRLACTRWQALHRSRAVLHHIKTLYCRVFAAWQAYARARSQHKINVSIATGHLAHRVQRVCFMAISLHAEKRRSLRQAFIVKLEQINLKAQASRIPQLLRGWQALSAYFVKLRHRRLAVCTETSLHFAHTVTQMWQCAGLLLMRQHLISEHAPQLAHTIWRRHYLLQWKCNMKARKAARDHQAAQLHMVHVAWTTWTQYCSHRQQRTRLAAIACKHWSSCYISKAWAGMKILHVELQAHVDRALWLRRMHASRRMRTILAWWISYAAQQERRQRVLQSLACMQQRNTAAFALTAWLTAGQEERSTCMACILQSTTLYTKAWHSWRQYHVQRACKRAQLQAAHASCAFISMRNAYRTWLLHSAEHAQHAVAVLAAEAHDQRRCTASWWRTWRRLLVLERRRAAVQAHTAAVFHDSYMKNVCLGWWRRWRDLRVARLAVGEAVTAQREHALLNRSFHCWSLLQQAHAPRRAAVEQRVRTAAAQRQHAVLTGVWAAWVERCRQQLVKHRQRTLGERHYLQHLQLRTLLAWQLWVRAQQAHQHAVWLALQQWRRWRLRRCLHSCQAWSHLQAWERRSEHVATVHHKTQLAARMMGRWKCYTSRMIWERERMRKATAMHEQFLLERCTSHLMQLGQARLQKRISLEVGRQTAAFAQDLLLIAPFAMHWLLVTRRSKTSRASACLVSGESWKSKAPGVENVSSMGNISQDVVCQGALFGHMVEVQHEQSQRQGQHIQKGRDASSRRQARRPTFL